MLRALETFKAPRGLAAAAKALDAITAAASRARAQLGSLKGLSVGNVVLKNNTGEAVRGTNNLIRSQGLLQSSILKTQTMWNALGGIFAAKFIIGAANDMIKIRAQLEAATGSAAQGRIQFLYLKEAAQNLGLEFVSLSRSYGFFLGSIKGTGLSLADAQKIFTGFTVAARGLQLSTADMDGVFRALGQIMSKGKLQAEELRQQLGDRLPGAFIRFARALDMTKPGELDQALKRGTISGKKLQDALVKLADSLKVEFTDAALKMTHTVDAAFNRLRNAFTFASDSLGQSGMNDALIEILDTLTKFVQSDALNSGLKAVASLFKFLGDHIEAVANIMGVLALNATLKWVGGLTLLSKAGSLVNIFMATGSVTAVQMAAGMGSVAVSTSLATRATAAFSAVLRANPLFWIAAVIMGVVWAYNKLTDTMTDQKEAMNSLNDKMADAENYFDAIIEQQIDLAKKTGDTTDAIYQQIHAMRLQAAEGSTQNVEGYRASYGFKSLTTGKASGIQGPDKKDLNPEDTAFIKQFFYQSGQGFKLKDLSGGGLTPDRKGFGQLTRVGGEIQARIKGRNPANPESDPLYGFLDTVRGRFNSLKSLSEEPNYKGNPYATWAGQTAGDYNHTATEEGLTGTMVGNAKKKGKSDAEKAAEKLDKAITNLKENIADLTQQATQSADVMDGLLTGSFDTVGAAAQQAGAAQLKSFEDTFDQGQKANAVIALANKLQAEGVIGRDEVINSYEDATRVITEYIAAQEDSAARAKKSAEVAGDVAQMREANVVTAATISIMKDKNVTQADVNKYQEIENALVGTAVKDQARLRESLGKEIDERERLKRLMEATNDLRDLENAKARNKEMSGIYASGVSPEDVDYYKQMFEARAKYIEQGASGQELRDHIAIKAALLNEARAAKELEDQYEKVRQQASDMADVIVNGFKDAVSGGENFLKSMKNIFKSLKDIIMDAVLYQPLKDFLTSAFTAGLSGQAGPKGSTTTYNTPAATAESGIGSISSVLNAATEFASAVGSSSQSNADSWRHPQYDADGYVVRNSDIVVTGPSRAASQLRDVSASIPPPSQQGSSLSYFKKIEQIFDFKANGTALKNLGTMIKGGKVLNADGSAMTAGQGISGALGAAGQALAAYQMGNTLGKGVAKALGGGFRTQAVVGGITGGAAAGYSLGGPVGAAVGAVIGGVLGFLKKKPKIPSAYGSVSVGAEGFAEGGAGGKYGKGDAKVGTTMASAGARMFNQFALEYNATLTPGKYGTFGARQFDKKGPVESFYSLTGNIHKGKPTGREGVDWIKGTDSEVQAFALISQVRKGIIKGLSTTFQTIFANTKATTMEGLNADLDTGKAYDAFVSGSFRLTDASKQVQDLNKTFNQLSRQAKELGLNTTKLTDARDRMMGQMKDEFNFQISQGILGFTNPAMQAFNALTAEYHDAVETAMAVGGDLSAVEDYYGRKRADLAKQWADIATNGLVSAAKDLYNSLTASSSSPLNAGTVFNNSRDLFQGLQSQIASGDYSNVGQLSSYTQNYLDSARNLYGSSSGYFDIFHDVTDFLSQMSAITGVGPGGTSEPPSLPSLDALVAEINEQSLEMVEATGAVGAAVIEGSTSIVDAIHNLALALGYNFETTPTTPTTGTGVGNVGTVGGGFGSGGSGGFRGNGVNVHLV
jgi:tape measure domain-containing protein